MLTIQILDRLPSLKVSTLLLTGLLLYDVFWVFFSQVWLNWNWKLFLARQIQKEAKIYITYYGFSFDFLQLMIYLMLDLELSSAKTNKIICDFDLLNMSSLIFMSKSTIRCISVSLLLQMEFFFWLQMEVINEGKMKENACNIWTCCMWIAAIFAESHTEIS